MPTLVKLLPNLYRWSSALAGPQQPVNSYVVVLRDRVVLIDPVGGDLTPAILFGAGIGSVRDILVTHMQAENITGAANFPGAAVHVPAGDEYLCEGEDAYVKSIKKWEDPWEWETRGNFKGHLGGARNERPSRMPLKLADSLVDGKTTAGFQVVATPGHGKNAVALLIDLDGKRIAFSGDLVFGHGQLWNWFDSDWDYGTGDGYRSLQSSAKKLATLRPDLLYPTHGDVVTDPQGSLALLDQRVETVTHYEPGSETTPINFPEKDSPSPGWREILPNLHQWRAGNCNVLISKTGNALVVDDGLCYWKPLPERARHHQQVMSDLKKALGIKRYETIIPTHYHGDHTENIPELVAMDGSEVICLDLVADTIDHPERFNIACPLPWYDTAQGIVKIDRRVKSGEHIQWHEFDLEIFHLAGQTYYHLGIEVTIDGVKTLFVGDGMHNLSGLTEPVLCYNKNDPETAGWLFGYERMIERFPDLLVCGHGSAVRNPVPYLKKKRDAWHKRLEEFQALSPRRSLLEFFDPFV